MHNTIRNVDAEYENNIYESNTINHITDIYADSLNNYSYNIDCLTSTNDLAMLDMYRYCKMFRYTKMIATTYTIVRCCFLQQNSNAEVSRTLPPARSSISGHTKIPAVYTQSSVMDAHHLPTELYIDN